MKILYFDCFAGISGDMTLAALIDLGIDKDLLVSELKKLNIEGWEIKISDLPKHAIVAKHVDVILFDEASVDKHNHAHGYSHLHFRPNEHVHEHSHEHKGIIGKISSIFHNHDDGDHHKENEHSHPHRNMSDISMIIDESSISERAKELAKRIFMRLAVAEDRKSVV